MESLTIITSEVIAYNSTHSIDLLHAAYKINLLANGSDFIESIFRSRSDNLRRGRINAIKRLGEALTHSLVVKREKIGVPLQKASVWET